MTLTINLVANAVAEVVEVADPADAIAALAARNLTPKGDPRHGQLLGTFSVPVGTYTVR